jgi:hypothetical protein
MNLKNYKSVLLFGLMALGLSYCSSPRQLASSTFSDNKTDGQELLIQAKVGKGHNHPTFVIWQEDFQGNYLKTLFITKSYASGIFGHANPADTVWSDEPGPSYQPSALPYWTARKGKIDNVTYIPTPEHPFTDAITGATPEANFKLQLHLDKTKGTRIMMEINQAWDWNDYWTNDKYPGSESYKHSAQPSLIYAVRMEGDMKEFYLNPIGHGDPKGSSGSLYTQLNTFTTAKEIFETIKIELK